MMPSLLHWLAGYAKFQSTFNIILMWMINWTYCILYIANKKKIGKSDPFLQWGAGGVTSPREMLCRQITKFAISVDIFTFYIFGT